MYEYQPPFNITNEIIDYISKIMEKIGNIDNYKDLDRLPRLRKQNRIRSIYSSCAIEANSLSLSEVTDIVNGKTVVGDETEIKEVKNAIKAYDLIEQIDPYSLKNLLEIHKIIANNLISNPGTLRNNAEGVFDGDRCIFIAPPSNMVPHLMESLFTWMKENQGKIHPLLLSCIFHYEFVFIHPFKDGNGRMARLWQTALLGKYKPIFYWMPIENYIKDNQKEYYEAISKSHSNGNCTVFIEFMLKMIDETLIKIKKEINKHAYHLSIYIQKLLNVMEVDVPLTSNEIMQKLNIKSKEALRNNYIKPAIDSGLIYLEIPDKPTSRNQRYIRK